MAIQMKALKSFKYGERRLVAGDRFQAKGKQDAKLLKAIGKAEFVEAAAIAPVATKTIDIVRLVVEEKDPVITSVIVADDVKTAVDEKTEVAQESVVANEQQDDDLEDMDFEALHALADKLGVNVHHRAGAQKVRQAIREFKAAQ